MIIHEEEKLKEKLLYLALLLCYACYIFINQQITMNKIKDEIANKKLEELKG